MMLKMGHCETVFFLLCAFSAVIASDSGISTNVIPNSTLAYEPQSNREGRAGFLETMQGFMQSAQAFTKLIGVPSSSSSGSGSIGEVLGTSLGTILASAKEQYALQSKPKDPPGSTSFYNNYYNSGHKTNYVPGQSGGIGYPVPSSGSHGDGYQIGQTLGSKPEASGSYNYAPQQQQQQTAALFSQYHPGMMAQGSESQQSYYQPPVQQPAGQQYQPGYGHQYVFGNRPGARPPAGDVNKQGLEAPSSLSSLLSSLAGGGGGGNLPGAAAGLPGGGASSGLSSLLSSLVGGNGGGVGNLPAAGAGFPGVGGAGVGGPGGAATGDFLSTLNSLGIFEDLTELLSFQNMDKILKNVNKFDSLKCIPRLVCQTIARREYEAAQREKEEEEKRRTSTTTTTTKRPKTSKGARGKDRDARLIPGFKIQGVDTALEQVVKFLDLMQLKDWALYPYVEGAYQGHQVRHWDECAYKFNTCPFSDEQLLYYFNNYKGGLFQSFRSDLKSEESRRELPN